MNAKEIALETGGIYITRLDLVCSYLLLIEGETSKPFNIKVPIQYAHNPILAAKLKEHNALKFGRDKKEVEDAIYARIRSASEKIPEKIEADLKW